MYRKEIATVKHGDKPPEPEHSDEFYCHRVLVKKKGKRKKEEPVDYCMTYIPWEDINDTELTDLALYGLEPGSRKEMEVWNVLSRALKRSELIGLIRNNLDPKDMEANPTHVARDRLSRLIHNNWKYIHSQIKCNTLCWECSDAKVLECILENKNMLRGDDL